jgi:hypothetical protein
VESSGVANGLKSAAALLTPNAPAASSSSATDPDPSCHDAVAVGRAHAMTEELEKMKADLHLHDAGQKKLTKEQEEAVKMEGELR